LTSSWLRRIWMASLKVREAYDPDAPAHGASVRLLPVGNRQRTTCNLLTQRIARVAPEQLG
jgi:hypothetical protein